MRKPPDHSNKSGFSSPSRIHSTASSGRGSDIVRPWSGHVHPALPFRPPGNPVLCPASGAEPAALFFLFELSEPTAMKRPLVATALLLPFLFAPACRGESRVESRNILASQNAAQQVQTNVSLPRMPSISPDGGTVVFSWHGDLWSVPSAGGNAIRISSHPADESWSRFSPDGSRIAFNSERRGSAGLYTMNADGTGVAEVLAFDRGASLSDWARDAGGSERLLFTASLEPDVYRSPRPYVIPA